MTGGTIAAGGLAVAGYRAAFADTTTGTEATTGTATEAGRTALSALDADLHARAWSPRGSAGLLAGALFVDALPIRTPGRAG
ncbi:triphosphoribosyl-dephospho-CoA synthase [Streptomyces bobili]|uniref:triphosphoribosyl-dephospho-CoA synthase n=1 Tax=Streptomyces bobili TaxID=67280 RepID=UPI00342A9427